MIPIRVEQGTTYLCLFSAVAAVAASIKASSKRVIRPSWQKCKMESQPAGLQHGDNFCSLPRIVLHSSSTLDEGDCVHQVCPCDKMPEMTNLQLQRFQFTVTSLALWAREITVPHRSGDVC